MTTLDKIKAEIQKVLDAEPDSENARAQALALFWVLELFDKYAEQEPKTGHWVLDGSDNSLECINCGCVIYANDIMRGEPHYCPNCGAKMIEPQESEDKE